MSTIARTPPVLHDCQAMVPLTLRDHVGSKLSPLALVRGPRVRLQMARTFPVSPSASDQRSCQGNQQQVQSPRYMPSPRESLMTGSLLHGLGNTEVGIVSYARHESKMDDHTNLSSVLLSDIAPTGNDATVSTRTCGCGTASAIPAAHRRHAAIRTASIGIPGNYPPWAATVLRGAT